MNRPLLDELARFYRALDTTLPTLPRWRCEAPRCGVALKANTKFCAGHTQNARERWREDAVESARTLIPEDFHKARFSNVGKLVKDPKIIAAVMAAVDEKMIVLMGDAGRGKTVLAACIANAILDAAGPGCPDREARRAAWLFWTDSYELHHARQQHGLGEGEAPAVERALRASVLFIDEVGSEPAPSVTQPSTVSEIVFRRQQEHRQTVITTWLDKGTLGARYSGGTARRMFERASLFQTGRSVTK